MDFFNSYEDDIRAKAYAKLEFHGTYYLAYRDLPTIIDEHIHGKRALDFGCGTGRSTHFLQQLGFTTVGVDISQEMIQIAQHVDSNGDYRLITDGNFSQFSPHSYDLVLSSFTFDNIPMEKKRGLFSSLATLLNKKGRIISLVSSPEMYTHEWASFSTKDFPENTHVKSGDLVPIITTDIDDKNPCYDILCPDEVYQRIYRESGLEVVKMYKPLATGDEPYHWANETTIAPWVIYALKKNR